VRHRQARPHHKLGNKVPISNAIETVLGDRIEPEFPRKEFPVYNKGVSGEGSRSQWENRDTRDQLPQALKIGGEVEGVGEDKV